MNGRLVGKHGKKKGNTKSQMERAPRGCIFVWCSEDTRYPKQLAGMIGRNDLVLVGPSWLRSEGPRKTDTPVMVDHAAPSFFQESHLNAWKELADRGILVD